MIAVIGIDRYRHWPSLSNAVTDARGVAALFEQLGFEQSIEPLINDRATATAIRSIVTDDLTSLGPDDSLVLFYAGHGGTRAHEVGGRVIKTGYLIPVDAHDSVATWIDLESWLRDVALLPPRHILVFLDACHSGIALAPILKWRDRASWRNAPLDSLRARRSRRIITSALDDQIALDSGPVDGHSLFTGCIIEALTHGIGPGTTQITGSELGVHLQQRVDAFPEARQTPDFGTFAFDDRGEMVIPVLVGRRRPPRAEPVIVPTLPAPTSPAPPQDQAETPTETPTASRESTGAELARQAAAREAVALQAMDVAGDTVLPTKPAGEAAASQRIDAAREDLGARPLQIEDERPARPLPPPEVKRRGLRVIIVVAGVFAAAVVATMFASPGDPHPSPGSDSAASTGDAAVFVPTSPPPTTTTEPKSVAPISANPTKVPSPKSNVRTVFKLPSVDEPPLRGPYCPTRYLEIDDNIAYSVFVRICFPTSGECAEYIGKSTIRGPLSCDTMGEYWCYVTFNLEQGREHAHLAYCAKTRSACQELLDRHKGPYRPPSESNEFLIARSDRCFRIRPNH